jgi:hypothetical protein
MSGADQTATTSRRCSTTDSGEVVKLDADVQKEIVDRLRQLRDLSAELAGAYDDPVARRGAEEMRESLERVLKLLGHK